MTRRATIAAVLVATALAAGCGGDDGDELGAPQGVPAAGANTPPAGTPGVPEGALYDIDGRQWRRLSQTEQFEVATAFVEDTPERCEGADIGLVVGYTSSAYGLDFPLDIPAVDVLLEGCDASAQS